MLAGPSVGFPAGHAGVFGTVMAPLLRWLGRFCSFILSRVRACRSARDYCYLLLASMYHLRAEVAVGF